MLKGENKKGGYYRPLVAVVGPTASGKSALALAIARRLNGEIVNTDSMQVYRHMDIGTAKPSRRDQALVAHHLLDRVNPDQDYSAGRYLADAKAAIADIEARGKLVVLCGGTGLYFRALLEGLAAIPPVGEEAKAQARALVSQLGAAGAHARLAQWDPVLAARLHPNDSQRVQRGLEVFLETGRPLSGFQAAGRQGGLERPVAQLGLWWEREALYQRVDGRVGAMLAAGWVEETRALLAMGYGPELKAMRALGYKEICRWLSGQGSEAELAQAIAQQTRHYAKRQLTWFRGQPAIQWHPPQEQAALVERLARALGEWENGL